MLLYLRTLKKNFINKYISILKKIKRGFAFKQWSLSVCIMTTKIMWTKISTFEIGNYQNSPQTSKSAISQSCSLKLFTIYIPSNPVNTPWTYIRTKDVSHGPIFGCSLTEMWGGGGEEGEGGGKNTSICNLLNLLLFFLFFQYKARILAYFTSCKAWNMFKVNNNDKKTLEYGTFTIKLRIKTPLMSFWSLWSVNCRLGRN